MAKKLTEEEIQHIEALKENVWSKAVAFIDARHAGGSISTEKANAIKAEYLSDGERANGNIYHQSMPSEYIFLSTIGRTEGKDLAAARQQLHEALSEEQSVIVSSRKNQIGLAAGLTVIVIGTVLGGPIGFLTSVAMTAGIYVVYQKLDEDAKPKIDFSLQEQKMLRDYNANILSQLSDSSSPKKTGAIVDETAQSDLGKEMELTDVSTQQSLPEKNQKPLSLKEQLKQIKPGDDSDPSDKSKLVH